MATPTSLNTRIVLRNDVLSAWEGSNKKLLKGEMALARLSGELSDKFEVRIGVGDKTWNELSGSNFIIPASNVVGLENELTSLKTAFYQEDSLDKLPKDATVTNGSIGVVLETITEEGKDPVEFRTAYWFDKTLVSEDHPNGTWRQMDGNYKATDVYFTDDMQMTYAFGKYAPKNGNFTLSCKNMSLHDVLQDAFAETKAPSVDQPAFTLTTTGTLTGEIGDTYNIPAVTFKMTNDGNYEYGPNPTGVSCTACTITTTAGSSGIADKSLTTPIVENGTLTTAAGTTGVAFLSTDVTYSYKATYTYSDGAEPKNNVGGLSAEAKIVGKANQTKTTSTKATGYYPYFMFYTTGDSCPDAINTSTATLITIDKVTIDGKKATQLSSAGTVYKTLEQVPTNILIGKTDKSGSYQNVYVVLPPKAKKNDWDGTMSNGVDGVAIQLVHKKDVTVTLLNGVTATYTAFMIENSAVVNDYLCQMKWS